MMDTTYQIFYTANLAFIVTHLYGWLLKWFYRPKAYEETFNDLFPAQRAVGTIYMLQILELPYLLQIGDADALFYANAFALLVFSLQMLVMCELYFFPQRPHPAKDYWIVLPAVVVLLPLFLQAVGLMELPDGWQSWGFVLVGLVFVWYFWRNVRMALRIGNEVRNVNEETYADTDDFPVRFAQFIQWVPTLVCVLLAINFYFYSPLAKCIRDVLFTIASIVFCIYTLNPHRKLFAATGENRSEEQAAEEDCQSLPEKPNEDNGFRLSDERYNDLRQRLESLLIDEHIFTEQHITANMIMRRIGTNANYLLETIKRSGYSSFYDMINQHRVRYAISLIRQQPDRRLGDIAIDCGFSSPSSMTKAFASQGKPAPNTFKS